MTTIAAGGVSSFYINGTNYLIGGDFTWNPATQKGEAVVGLTGFAGIKYTGIEGAISTTLMTNSEFDPNVIAAMSSVSIVVTLRDGRIIQAPNMSIVDIVEEDSAGMSCKVKFVGASVTINTP